MAILQVRDIDDRIYSTLKKLAKKENRSLSQEVISIIEKYLLNTSAFTKNPTAAFLSLSNSWEDKRSDKEIIRDIKNSRIKSSRFGDESGLFN
jgi:plasmid stability protein